MIRLSSWGNGKSILSGFALAIFALAIACAAPAHAQSGAQQDSVGEDAVDAVTQPLSDLNLRQKEIPLILLLAQNDPYGLGDVPDCASMRREITRLDEVLGPDADAEQQKAGLINRGLRIGGNVVGGMIPFRGIVRRVSGARAEEKRWEAAIYGGVARRSFLKGYLQATECPVDEDAAVQSARDVLGIANTQRPAENNPAEEQPALQEAEPTGPDREPIISIDPDAELIDP